MFDRYLIQPGSLQNEIVAGEKIGFQMTVRMANYRGNYLSLHNGYFIEVDGINYAKELQSFEINGKAPRTFEELKNAVWEHWDYEDDAILHVKKPGGLSPGKHTIRFQQSILNAYGYMPTDEEWIKNPPLPGTNAGSDKTPLIVTFEMDVPE
jgi:hypothetical protein